MVSDVRTRIVPGLLQSETSRYTSDLTARNKCDKEEQGQQANFATCTIITKRYIVKERADYLSRGTTGPTNSRVISKDIGTSVTK